MFVDSWVCASCIALTAAGFAHDQLYPDPCTLQPFVSGFRRHHTRAHPDEHTRLKDGLHYKIPSLSGLAGQAACHPGQIGFSGSPTVCHVVSQYSPQQGTHIHKPHCLSRTPTSALPRLRPTRVPACPRVLACPLVLACPVSAAGCVRVTYWTFPVGLPFRTLPIPRLLTLPSPPFSPRLPRW